MNCENCEQKFICFTTDIKHRPKIISGVNKNIRGSCRTCTHIVFNNNSKFGICSKHNLLTIEQCQCASYKPNEHRKRHLKFIYNDINKEANKRVRGNKLLPKYCIKEDGV